MCVRFAVDGLLKRGFNVTLVSDAIASLNNENIDKNVSEWKENDKFRILKFDEIK